MRTLSDPRAGYIAASALGIFLALNGPAHANPPLDAIKDGLCLELKVNGQAQPCNSDMRLVDDGKGTITFVTGYGPKRDTRTIVSFTTAQTPTLENAYGYALPVSAVTLLTLAAPNQQTIQHAAGLCFMVKPNPVRAGKQAVRQDVVVMCSATLTDEKADVRRLDWKFVF